MIHVDIKTVYIPHDPTVFFILAPGLKVHEGHWDTTAVNQKRSIDSLREINNYLDRIRKRETRIYVILSLNSTVQYITVNTASSVCSFDIDVLIWQMLECLSYITTFGVLFK